jgi:hypothetical protein
MKKEVPQQSDFIRKVTKGLQRSYKQLIKAKIEKNQSVVIMHNGKMMTVKASELKNL